MGKLNSKFNPINNKQQLEVINYLTSEHVQSLQQSEYIKLENDVNRIMAHNSRAKTAYKLR